ncbi:MAG: hypothetical protein GXY53_02400 [Desulfobulbus sp.]|nr:hypothetical protein [Desulfobulbus sp.]
MKRLVLLFTFFMAAVAWADIPATPLMTLYRFNGDLSIPYYDAETFRQRGPVTPAGSLPQGTSVIPCLMMYGDAPLTDGQGIPYVGFEVAVDPRRAAPTSAEQYRNAFKSRESLMVVNHHCPVGIRYVLDVRNLYAMAKPPRFDPPPVQRAAPAVRSADNGRGSELDQIIRTFHNSAACSQANLQLLERRQALQRAWNRFILEQQDRWSAGTLRRAMHLDYVMRTALFEGHLGRGCSAYGSCERNIIALSIRNRGLENCLQRQGCRAPGDFQGVVTAVSQYNIWDEFLTQISGLTSCFLRDDLADISQPGTQNYQKLQRMYAQNIRDIERILYGSDADLAALFPGSSLSDLKALKHYYHAPAMGKCFPAYNRVEYMSGAVARNGNNFALIANTRIHVDRRVPGGYLFRSFMVREEPDRDVISVVDNYPGFVVDGRRVSLASGRGRCTPYGLPQGCSFQTIGRYRKTPSWVNDGKPYEVHCRTTDRGEQCLQESVMKDVRVGGRCDVEMQPFVGVH